MEAKTGADLPLTASVVGGIREWDRVLETQKEWERGRSIEAKRRGRGSVCAGVRQRLPGGD